MNTLYSTLKKFGRVQANVPLAKLSTFNIGGPAEFVLTVTQTSALVSALTFLSGEGVDFFILGGGSNILFPDDGLPGVVIKNKSAQLTITGSTIYADAGVELKSVVEAATRAALTGFEWAAGIPGSVGGAIRGNAGARYAFTGGEMKDAVTSVAVWRGGEPTEFTAAQCAFGYRDSAFKQSSDVVLGMTMALKPGNAAESLAMTQKIILERRSKQPPQSSAGSFFKNIFLDQWQRDPAELPERFLQFKKIAAGWLVEQAGCKGYTVGAAQVSTTHANFIVNCGGATQADVLAVQAHVTDAVFQKFGIQLEEEVMIVRG